MPFPVAHFVRTVQADEVPASALVAARRSLLDLIGIAAAGRQTALAGIACNHAAAQMTGAPGARVLFDGRRASMAGAAFAGAATVDALDGHDGHVLTKGHAGAAILPALLALADAIPRDDDRELLLRMVIGYEVATRAGIALHSTVVDYHCSGAWNALGCAAVAARHLEIDEHAIRHALGAAEYFGPRGQILRTCEAPSMVKDGSCWGAHAGVTAALLARDGFTGAPALTVEARDVEDLWSDLGVRWRIAEQYFKPYPVCRWAQPAIEAALSLRQAHAIAFDAIDGVVVESFAEAVALGLHCTAPRTTEEAQYSITHPVAAALIRGDVGVDEVSADGLADARIADLRARVRLVESPHYSRRFPAERWARVTLELRDGRRLASQPAQARGDPECPLDDDAVCAKFHALADAPLGDARAARIGDTVADIEAPGALDRLLDDLLAPLASGNAG